MHYSLLTEETMEAFFKAAHQENLRPEAIWIDHFPCMESCGVVKCLQVYEEVLHQVWSAAVAGLYCMCDCRTIDLSLI